MVALRSTLSSLVVPEGVNGQNGMACRSMELKEGISETRKRDKFKEQVESVTVFTISKLQLLAASPRP